MGTVYMRNDDPFANQVVAWDQNANNQQIFQGTVAAHATQPVSAVVNDSGYINVVTSTDNNPSVGHSLLHDGDSFDI